MKKEQSSIEWLESRVLYMALSSQKSDLRKLFDKAKELHKKEIIGAHLDGQYFNVNGEESNKYGEKYYTEKYSTE